MKHFPTSITRLEPFSEAFDAYRLKSEQVDMYFAEYPAGKDIAPHAHETHNDGVVIAGELHLMIDGNTLVYRVGDWYHIPANKTHSARFETDTAIIELWFKP